MRKIFCDQCGKDLTGASPDEYYIVETMTYKKTKKTSPWELIKSNHDICNDCIGGLYS